MDKCRDFDKDDRLLMLFIKSININILRELASQDPTKCLDITQRGWLIKAFTWSLSEEHLSYWSRMYDGLEELDDVAIKKLQRYVIMYELMS